MITFEKTGDRIQCTRINKNNKNKESVGYIHLSNNEYIFRGFIQDLNKTELDLISKKCTDLSLTLSEAVKKNRR